MSIPSMDQHNELDVRKKIVQVQRLSARQRECLDGVISLKSAKRIAHDLGVSASAVEKHLRQAREKLDVPSTAQAAQIYAALTHAEKPQWGISHLAGRVDAAEMAPVLHLPCPRQYQRVEDNQPELLPLDQSLTPLQTMITIFAMSVTSIFALLLLISCARAVESILVR
jgi:DNA-binding CsgD family transcriptional regulator